VVSDTGGNKASLTKRGDGTLTLSAANTYTGDTTIEKGTVRVAVDEALSTGFVHMTGGRLDGDSIARGVSNTVSVDSGKSTLGTIQVGKLVFSPGATLIVDGVATVRDAAAQTDLNGGVISVGQNSSLTVAGGLKSSVQSVMLLDPQGKIIAPGKTVNLDKVTARVSPDVLARVARTLTSTNPVSSTVIEAATVSNAPTFVEGSSPVIGLVLVVDSVNGTLSLVQQRTSYSTLAKTPGAKAFANALQPLTASNDPGVSALIRALDAATTSSDIDSILSHVSPGAAYASLYTVGVKRSLSTTAALDAHLENIAAAGGGEGSVSFGVRPTMLTPGNNTSVGSSDHTWTAWTAGYGTRSTIDADVANGFGKTRTDEYGASLGIERQIGSLRIGVLTALGQTDTDFDPAVKVKSDSWNIGGYGSVALGSVTVDATAIWGSTDNKSTRESFGGLVSGKFNSNDTQLGLGVAVNVLEPTSAWHITPVARVKYIDYSQDAFSETGTGLKFDTDKISESTVISKLGVRVGRRGESGKGVALGVDGGAFWVHDYNADGKPVALQLTGVSNSSFTATGRKADADLAQLTLGLQATFSDSVTLRLSGQQEYGSNRSQSTGILSFAVNF